MSTVVLIVILIVLLILACTFGLIKKSKNKERRDPFSDVVTTLATDPNLMMNPVSSIPAYSHSVFADYPTQIGTQPAYSVASNIVQASTSGEVVYAQQLRPENQMHPYQYQSVGPGVTMPGHSYASPYGPYPPGDPRWMAIPPGMDRSIMGSAEA